MFGVAVVSYDAYAEAAAAQPLVYQAAVNDSVIYQKDGDLALDPDGLEAIMTKVVGAATCAHTRVSGDVDAAVQRINAEFGNNKAYVYGFVNGTAGWLAATNFGVDPFAGPAAAPRRLFGHRTPVGEHILVITAPITRTKAHYLVPTWTWAESFTARIPIAHLPGYLAGCTHGRL